MPYAGHPRSHTRRSYGGAIRGGHTACWFSRGLGTTGEVIHRGHTQKPEMFFRYIAIRGPYGKPYVEVIRRGHTWSCFSMVSGPAVEAIHGGHTWRPHGNIFFDTFFLIYNIVLLCFCLKNARPKKIINRSGQLCATFWAEQLCATFLLIT